MTLEPSAASTPNISRRIHEGSSLIHLGLWQGILRVLPRFVADNAYPSSALLVGCDRLNARSESPFDILPSLNVNTVRYLIDLFALTLVNRDIRCHLTRLSPSSCAIIRSCMNCICRMSSMLFIGCKSEVSTRELDVHASEKPTYRQLTRKIVIRRPREVRRMAVRVLKHGTGFWRRRWKRALGVGGDSENECERAKDRDGRNGRSHQARLEHPRARPKGSSYITIQGNTPSLMVIEPRRP